MPDPLTSLPDALAALEPGAGPGDPQQQGPPRDDSQDKQKILDLVDRCRNNAKQNTARKDRDRQDLLNLLFYRGGPDNQWVVWDHRAQTYVRRPYEGEGGIPEYVPRCTSNLFKRKIDSVAALADQSYPAQEFKPATDDDNDRATADVAEAGASVLLDEIGYENLKPRANKLCALTNLVGFLTYYDTNPKYGTKFVPVLMCAACGNPVDAREAEQGGGNCPDCGADASQLQPATYPEGHPQAGQAQGHDEPVGKVCAQLLSSFEISGPAQATAADAELWPWILTHTRYTKEDVLSQWGDVPGVRDLVESNTSAGNAKLMEQQYADQMKRISSPRLLDVERGRTSPGTLSGPIVWRIWHDPLEDDEFSFPNGLYATLLEEDVVLESGPLPLQDDEGRPIKNIILRTWTDAPGAPFGVPPGDDLVPIQIQQNLTETLAFLILMHDSANTTFIPTSVTLFDELRGQPGANVRYRPSTPGEKPFVVQGKGFPEALKYWLTRGEELFDKVSGLNAVLEGARPQGDPTLGEIQILQERGLATFKEPLQNQAIFERRLVKMLLFWARQSGWAPRFYQVRGENGGWEVKQFLGSDLTGRVNISSEPTSAWPRSQLLMQMRISEAVKIGFINPQDPEVQEEYLSLQDLTDFKKSFDTDRKQIARQLDRWKQAQTPAEIEPAQEWWNLPRHMYFKTEFMKTEEAEAIKIERGEVYQAMLGHLQQIKGLMQPAAPPGGPGGAPGGAGAEAQPPGAGGALEAAMKSGALTPAGAQNPGSKGTLDAAVRSGAMTPAAGPAVAPRAARSPIPSRPPTPMRQPLPPTPGPMGPPRP